MKKITLVIFAAFLAINCSNDDVTTTSDAKINPTINKSILVERQNEMNYDLWNEDSKIIGDVEVYDDTEHVFISCQTNLNFQHIETGLFLGLYEKLPALNTMMGTSAFTHFETFDITSETRTLFFKIKKSQLQTDANGCIFVATYFTLLNLETKQFEKAFCVSNHLPRKTKSTHFLYCIR